MKYLALLDNDSFKIFKERRGLISLKLRLYLWVKHLSSEVAFDEFFGEEREEAFLKSKEKNRQAFMLETDKEDWTAFKANCARKNISSNTALNIILTAYAKSEYLFVISINI